MIRLVNHDSGELSIEDGDGIPLRLSRDQTNRLIMMARMHTTEEFLEKLPTLILNEALQEKIRHRFQGKSSTERWNLKEKFARLTTLTKGYESKDPKAVLEKILFE